MSDFMQSLSDIKLCSLEGICLRDNNPVVKTPFSVMGVNWNETIFFCAF